MLNWTFAGAVVCEMPPYYLIVDVNPTSLLTSISCALNHFMLLPAVYFVSVINEVEAKKMGFHWWQMILFGVRNTVCIGHLFSRTLGCILLNVTYIIY